MEPFVFGAAHAAAPPCAAPRAVDAGLPEIHTPPRGERPPRDMPSPPMPPNLNPVSKEVVEVEKVISNIKGHAQRGAGIYRTSYAAEAAVLAIGALVQEKSDEFKAFQERIKQLKEAARLQVVVIEEKELQHKEHIKRLESEHQAKITMLDVTHAATIERINDAHKKALDEINATFQTELEEMRSEHQTEIGRLTLRYEEKIAVLELKIEQLTREVTAADNSVQPPPQADGTGFLFYRGQVPPGPVWPPAPPPAADPRPPCNLDVDQQSEVDATDAIRQKILRMMQDQTPTLLLAEDVVTVSSQKGFLGSKKTLTGVKLPPGQSVTFQLPDGLIQSAVGQPRFGVVQAPVELEAAIMDPTTSCQIMLVGAVLEAPRDGGSPVKITVKEPLRGAGASALLDPGQYGERSIVIIIGSKLFEVAVDIVPPEQLRLFTGYEGHNAVTGDKIPGPGTMTLKWGGASSVWESVTERTILAAPDGTFSISSAYLPKGTVLVTCTMDFGEQFELYSFQFVSHSKMMTQDKGIQTISPKLLKPTEEDPVGTIKEVRVVLKWGTDPKDLDLHCVTSKNVNVGPNKEGNHMWYKMKEKNGQMRLDKDETQGCQSGETLTLDRLQSGVSYWFGVHHYDGEGTLATSGATIEIYGLTPELLNKAGQFGQVGFHNPFKIAVPVGAPEGLGKKAVWRGFGLMPAGENLFSLKVANVLVSGNFTDEDTAPYRF